MTVQEIKQAVDNGKTVHWNNGAYEVRKDKFGSYNIKCILNDSIIGLTWLDGTTLNGKPEEFYIADN